MSELSTETLTRFNDVLKMAGWIVGTIAVLAVFGEWLTGRELDNRRNAEAGRLRQQVETSERAATQAQEVARALRQGLASRDVSPEQRARMVEILRTTPGKITIYYADTEGHVYAKRLETIFRDAGWTPTLTGAGSFGPILAFSIETARGRTPPARVAVLQRAIEEALQQPVKRLEQGLDDDDEVNLSVPHKPATE